MECGFTLPLAPGCARTVESEVAAATMGREGFGRREDEPAAPKLPQAAAAGSLTTEYPANGSFFRPQNPSARAKASAVAVCKELSRVGSPDRR
jgi:hypothetical protein